MFKFAFASMRSSVGRLVAAGIAIVLGTAFVTATLLSTDVVRATAEAAITADLNGADVVVDTTPESKFDVAAIESLPGVKGVDQRISEGLPLRGYGGTRYLDIRSLPVHGTVPTMASGTVPSANGEIAISEDAAKALRVGVGDKVDWDSYNNDAKGTLTVTGITDQQSLFLRGPAPVWATTETISTLQKLRGTDEFAVSRLLVYGDGTVDAAALVTATKKTGTELFATSAREVIDRELEDLTGNTRFFTVFGMAFAAVAIIVAGMVIANTFEVLVAQRARLLALIRCGGATKGQVRRSVLIEAAMLGLIASIVGVLLGVALGQGAAWFLSSQTAGIASISLAEIAPATYLVPIVIGMGVTLLAALGPARAATRVSPVAALRPLSADPARSGSRARLWLGLATTFIGLAMLLGPALYLLAVTRLDAFADQAENLEPATLMPKLLLVGILGGLLTVTGFLVLSVYIVPHVVKFLGAVVSAVLPGEAKATARLATSNAIRNPRRTAATTSALVIGVGLVVMMGTGAATARATLTQTLGSTFPADVSIIPSQPDGLRKAEIEAAEKVEGVLRTTEGWASHVGVNQKHASQPRVLVADPVQLNATIGGRDFTVKQGHVAVSGTTAKQMKNLDDGITLDVFDEDHNARRSVTLPVQVIDRLQTPVLVAPATMNLDLGAPDLLLIDIDDTKASQVVADIERDVSEAGGNSPAIIHSPIEMRAQFNQVIDALLAILIGLLGVAVVIAIVGVANTLTLSVIERRREHGVLRAVGVTQPQLRHMLAVEGVLIAVAGTVIGIILGVLSGFAGTTILLGTAPDFVLGLGWRIILGCVVIALLAGLLASVLPARNAAKVPVVVALSTA